MLLRPIYLVRQAVCFAAAAAALGLLSGCQAVLSNPPLTQIRVIAASPDAPGMDVYQGGNAMAYSLGFGTVTSYVPMSPGTYTFAANSAGTKQVLTSSKATLAALGQYTILVGDVAASLQQVVLTDQSQAAPGGQIALRFIDQATRVGAVDVYLVPAGKTIAVVSPVTTGVVFGSNTGYLNVPAGTYTLMVVPAGTVPASTTVATYAGSQVSYSAGAARTIVLIDQQLLTTPGLQVITADDYDSPAATS